MGQFKNNYRIESNRLTNWDYTNNSFYFITICTYQKSYYFGNILHNEMKFSELGHIALNCWCEIPSHYPNAILDEFIIMPNHVHAIINLQNDEYKTYDNLSNVDGYTNHKDVACNASTNSELSQKMSGVSSEQKSLPAIIRSYKSAVSRLARRAGHGFNWQPNYYDRVIRNEIELQSIRHYIRYNPLKWDDDENNIHQ